MHCPFLLVTTPPGRTPGQLPPTRLLRLDQLATVIDNVEDNRNASWLYSKTGSRRAINLQVMRQPGSNTIEVADNINRFVRGEKLINVVTTT